MDLHILIPVKPLTEGKSRLAPVLDAEGRLALCERFLRRTLALATAASGTLVVTRDPVAAAIAAAAGARVVQEPAGADLNAALDAGRQVAGAATPLLVLPIDLPRLQPATLQRLGAATGLVIVPDRGDSGTNLLLLPRTAVAEFRFAYGIGSLEAHRAEAARLGLAAEVLRLPDAAFDVDAPEDYAELTAERAQASQGS